MKDIEFLATGLKLLGSYFIFMTLVTGVEAYVTMQQFSSVDMGVDAKLVALSTYLPVALYCIVGLLLFTFPVSISKTLLPRSNSEGAFLDFGKNNLLVSGTVLLGIFILSRAIPDLVFNLLLLQQTSNLSMQDSYQHTETIAYTVSTVLELAVGTWLVFGSKGVMGYVAKIRA